jgi:2-phosphoglycerate kinase
MTVHVLYLVGGAPRVGKSALAQRLLEADGIPWLPTDVIRTVLRRVLPGLDASTRTRSTPRGLPR